MGARKRDNAGDQITARQELIRGFEGVGNSAFDRLLHLQQRLGLIWTGALECNGTAHGSSPAAESAISDSRPRRRFCGGSRDEGGHAEHSGGSGGACLQRIELGSSDGRGGRLRMRLSSPELMGWHGIDARVRPKDLAARG